MRSLHTDYCEEYGNKIKVNERMVVIVHCVNGTLADEKVRDCFWHFFSQTSPSITDVSDQPDGSSTKESESDPDSEGDMPLSKLSKV